MNPIKVERFKSRRRQRMTMGFGCFAVMGTGMVFLCALLYATGLLTTIVLGILGVRNIGETDTLFEVTPVPTTAVQNINNQSLVIFDMGAYGEERLDTDPESITFVTGDDEVGNRVASVGFSEAGLLQLCRDRSPVCANGDGQYRNAYIDLRPNGAIVFVDINAGVFWQQVGIVLQLNDSRTVMRVVGVDINGSTYDPATLPQFLPAEARQSILNALTEVETVVNDLLQDIIVRNAGKNYRIDDVQIDNERLTLLMR